MVLVSAAAAGIGLRSGSATPTSGSHGRVARAVAIRLLLERRARAILHHDRAALLATVDPTQRRFAATQVRMLADLRRVPLASWSYSVGTAAWSSSGAHPPPNGVPTYTPVVVLHYRLRGFDTEPTALPQYPTFTQRAGRWYLTSLDGAAGGHVSATDLWDYGPVDVVRRPGVLVLGPPTMLGTMHQVADGLYAAVPRVTAVWGPRWPRRVVAEVPQTQHELAAITGDTGDLSSIAALNSAEVDPRGGDPAAVGDRVSVNPATWPSLDPRGRRVVLTHELTHVASRADTGARTPRWLQEGFADYVGFRGTGVATPVAAAELAAEVRAGRVPRRLPADQQFAGSSTRLAQAYEEGWLACRLIAVRAGQRTLVRFYRLVGSSSAPPAAAVDRALHRLLSLSTRRFTSLWRDYLHAQLA